MADMLSAIVGSFGLVPTLTDIRLGAMVLLSFAAFLRYDEVAKLQCCDIKFTHECMSVVICLVRLINIGREMWCLWLVPGSHLPCCYDGALL